MHYIGLDVHKRVVEACIIDNEGTVIKRMRFATTHDEFKKFLTEHASAEDHIALEATTNSWGVLDILEPYVEKITVSNAMRTKAIAQSKIKTDKVDAEVLAQLLRCNYLPGVWAPDTRTKRLRSLTKRRASLVRDRVGVKNRIHSVLHQRLIHSPVTDLFCKKGREWLANLEELDEDGRFAIEADLCILDQLEAQIQSVENHLLKINYDDKRLKLLLTLPGVDSTVALSVLAALGNIERFKSPEKAASYLGLVPSTKQSGAPVYYHGHITKQGNTQARWMLIQAAQHVRNHPGPIGNFYRKLAKRRGHNIAVVATARKLVTYAWYMLKNNETYRYAQPGTTKSKLQKLRTKVTGERRKGGNKKGEPRPSNYGKGISTKLVPSLGQVYSSEGLPQSKTFDELPAGEKKYLREQELEENIRSFEKAKRVIKKRRLPDSEQNQPSNP